MFSDRYEIAHLKYHIRSKTMAETEQRSINEKFVSEKQ
jgi:hypothetical protein